VRHGICNNTLCIEHLSIGTALHNSLDKDRDGTNYKEEQHPACKLTRDLVQHDTKANFNTAVEQAAFFHLPVDQIRSIHNGGSWVTVPKNGKPDTVAVAKREARKANERARRAEIRKTGLTIEKYRSAWSRLRAKRSVRMVRPDLVATPCWLFTGTKQDGYGYTTVDNLRLAVHVLSWEMHHNHCQRKPAGRCRVLHACAR